jgi:hypothetical protein
MSTQIQIASKATPAGITGQIQFNNAGAFGADSSLFWDNTNKRLGIGANSNSPSAALQVRTNVNTAHDVFNLQNGLYGDPLFRVRDNATGSAASTCSFFMNGRIYGGNSTLTFKEFDLGGYGLGASYGDAASNGVWLNNQGNIGDGVGSSVISVSSNVYINLQTTKKYKFEAQTGNFGIGNVGTLGARLDVRAQGALSTDIAFRVRNSADTANIISANGRGDVFIGLNAGRITTGINNTFVGIQSGFSNITGQENTAIGTNAGFANLGSYNTYLGVSAGQNGTTATGCTFIGYNAGQSSNAQYGVFIGYSASTTGGNGTVAIGYNAGAGTGVHNLSLGQSSGVGMTTGNYNTHLGYRSVASGITTGNYNNLLGSDIVVGAVSNNAVLADNQGNQAIRKDANHNVLLGKEVALATNATNGFAYFPTCAGIPTGVPAASFTGKAPIVIDSTNNKMYIYTNAAWVALN